MYHLPLLRYKMVAAKKPTNMSKTFSNRKDFWAYPQKLNTALAQYLLYLDRNRKKPAINPREGM